MSGIDSCLKIAKLTAAAGEMAPFPFIKGAAQFVSAAKNRQDLQDLAESIVTTLVVVRDTIIDHGPTSALCFKDICLDFQTYLDNLLSKLNKETRLRGIRRLLKAKKISDDISAYRQRVQAAKEDFLIRTTTMTRLVLSDVHDEVTTGFSTLNGSVAASERNITSTIEDNIEEIRTWGARQSEDIQKLSARLQGSRQWDIYKGKVWDIIPGDIRIIKRATASFCCTVTYKDSYCTIGNSNTWKIIREYQAPGDNGEDPMKQLDQAFDLLMKQRHPNLPQIFGVCRSPDFPAIIFHGTTRVPLHHYLHGLSATRFIQFFSESVKAILCVFLVKRLTSRCIIVQFQDLQSVSEVLPIECYRYTGYSRYDVFDTGEKEDQPYVNEYGKLVFGDLPYYNDYWLGPFNFSYTEGQWKYGLSHAAGSRASGELLHSQKIFGLWHHTLDSNLQPAPTPTPTIQDFYSPLRVLVGRVRPWPYEWKWDTSCYSVIGSSIEVVCPSFDNGLVSIELSWADLYERLCINVHTHWEDSDEIVKSWIAQTSKLDSCLRSRGYGDNLEAYIITDVDFQISISSKRTDEWYEPEDDFCGVCNAKDRYHHALSLSITAPVIDYETNTITSCPVVSCSRVCGMNSLKEEKLFTIDVRGHATQTQWGWLMKHMVCSTIPELHAEHGFDPVRDGADVCEYFGWPLLEILDPSTGDVKWYNISVFGAFVSHIRQYTGTDVATGSIEEAHAEAPTKTEIVPVVQHDISTRALIIIFIVISVQVILLSSFEKYL
ncbi:hypothetical protein EDD85DRAFT_975149 [Armillaria nabsnona]|nr:hypothetical protein EDD85DRAFT_975149 [Armillaria nabsnona]